MVILAFACVRRQYTTYQVFPRFCSPTRPRCASGLDATLSRCRSSWTDSTGSVAIGTTLDDRRVVVDAYSCNRRDGDGVRLRWIADRDWEEVMLDFLRGTCGFREASAGAVELAMIVRLATVADGAILLRCRVE